MLDIFQKENNNNKDHFGLPQLSKWLVRNTQHTCQYLGLKYMALSGLNCVHINACDQDKLSGKYGSQRIMWVVHPVPMQLILVYARPSGQDPVPRAWFTWGSSHLLKTSHKNAEMTGIFHYVKIHWSWNNFLVQ